FCLSFATIAFAADTTAPATAAVRLTGITTLFGDKRAFLLVSEPATAGQSVAATYSCTLSEGQSSGPVEVLQVDAAAGRVRIRNGETQMDLTFSRNGAPISVAPASTAPPPEPQQPMMPICMAPYVWQPP